MDPTCPPSPRFRDDQDEINAEHLNEESNAKISRREISTSSSDLTSMPWLGWLFVYAFVHLILSACRCLALKSLITMYGAPDDNTVVVQVSVLSLGGLEDFVCTTYLATVLWLFDTVKRTVLNRCCETQGKGTVLVAAIATFSVSWWLVLVVLAPILADLVLVLYRDLRFSFGLVATLVRERHFLKDAPITTEEIHAAYAGAVFLILIATMFALVRVLTPWSDLSLWHPLTLVFPRNWQSKLHLKTEKSTGGVKYTAVGLEEGSEDAFDHETLRSIPSSNALDHPEQSKCSLFFQILSTLVVPLVVVPSTVYAIRRFCSPFIAYAALNVTLNEFSLHAFQPASSPLALSSDETFVHKYVDHSELYEPFGTQTLYRRTIGFQGPLAFNVSIDRANPPNVLLVAVESFRFRDSRYLVGREDPSYLFKGTNMTLTPHFDRWAKRGVAFRNIWSSIPTSRSLESLLFGQIPYESDVGTGITGGKADTSLSGLPHLFSQKGYETYFTTGSSISLDNWNLFLPTHGFNTVWSVRQMKLLAQQGLKIRARDWRGAAHRGFHWGVHDDVSFKILGNLLMQKNRQRKERVAQGKPSTPLFLTHYTISSHDPFASWPKWYNDVEKPDFSRLVEGEPNAEKVRNYFTVRSFTDRELGHFLDRMETEGVLNDTIVIIVGDHGQAPESNNPHAVEESCTRIPAAIIAEGRLGDAVGLVIDDVAEQYDMLNTLADITGLPPGGFLQTGVGRSLKRKFPSGDRIVYSNDPLRKMSIVQGHLRLRYDAATDAMMLHNTETDFHMKRDLFPDLPLEEQAKWKEWREDGRRITAYYKNRWDGKCLLAVDCDR